MANPDFSRSRYVRGQEQFVTRVAPKRPHAADEACRPYKESSPSLPMHFLASTFWANALADNWRHSHHYPSEGRNPYASSRCCFRFVSIQYATIRSNAKGAAARLRPAGLTVMLHGQSQITARQQPFDCNPLLCTVRFRRCDFTQLCACPPLDCPERSGLAEFLWQDPLSAF